ncbi:uncharacterized protein EI90DRAFT_3052550, partial [Cantharellus anzutake]|uniref:uncharacterized protein n=1 Tax=Cantharellus anzutake TaxID=1750568 RepID=UPI00190657E2
MFGSQNRSASRSRSPSPSADRGSLAGHKRSLPTEPRSAHDGFLRPPSAHNVNGANSNSSTYTPTVGASAESSSVRRPPTSGDVFDAGNIKALEDRLVLWERAVRTRVMRN